MPITLAKNGTAVKPLSIHKGSMRPHWYRIPKFGILFRRPYLVWLDRFWWLS